MHEALPVRSVMSRMLVAAMNPCPCGFSTDPTHEKATVVKAVEDERN